jgi:hypothetical protein
MPHEQITFSDESGSISRRDFQAESTSLRESSKALSNQAWAMPEAKALAPVEATRAMTLDDKPSSTWLQLGGISHHIDRSRNFNEQNWGIGIEHKLNKDNPLAIGNDSSISVGQYRNSIDKTSHYLLYHYKPIHVGPFNIGVMAGAVDGYHLNKGGPIPLVLPVASIEGRHVGANFMCVPKMKDISAVCAVQFKVRY